jgi:hypothetical protein
MTFSFIDPWDLWRSLIYLLSCSYSRQRQQSQKNPLESQVAPCAVKPLLQRMSAAAYAAAAYGDGFPSKRERDVGICRSSLNLRRIAEVRVDRANHF